jgi:hypothetical protein
MAMDDTTRQKVHFGLMRYWSQLREVLTSVLKADIRSAVNAADDWIDTNQASYNSALPVNFRNNASAGQKAFLLAVVALAKYNLQTLRDWMGGID